MKEYIKTKATLNRSCLKTHITYTFFITEAIQKFNILFTYTPKTLKNKEAINSIVDNSLKDYPVEVQEVIIKEKPRILAINNLLTLSLDDENGFRGAIHNHQADKLLFISEANASNGLICGKIEQGLWKLTINCHGIYSEEVTYELRVWGDESE